jgi:protein SCO1/2
MARRVGAAGSGGAALAALAVILLVTAAWWALALWPAEASARSAWLERARAVCFGVGRDGLPDAGGWALLVGEPLGMIAVLVAVWGDRLRLGLRSLAASAAGRGVLTAVALSVMLGIAAVVGRVRASAPAASAETSALRRIDRPAPQLRLVDQHGDSVGLAEFRGRPVMVGFAYGHCETVCPTVVRNMLDARARARAAAPAILLVTLDPWRDTPRRLASLAAAWRLSDDARVLSGEVESVNRAIDAWGVMRSRDARTGELVHAPDVFLVDREGRLAYRVSGGAALLAELMREL